ncbi:MAG: selenocysteine-specific translation elongation factor [Armatimonadetes bacterium]|nr:selenocysteine-specific translation elongation factor [Armatimonadota bacterium]
MIVGTAGHVDHGKSSLIQALTGADPDRLPDEKRRGLTIDLGFASMELDGQVISFIDVPGHERFVTNMLAGATGMDIALLCVAADEGVKPQTEEHLLILKLLNVRAVVLVMTRCDAATSDQLEVSQGLALELLAENGFAEPQVVLTSAKTGQGLDQLRALLSESLKEYQSRKGGAWLSIDRVFTVEGRGTVATGTLASGRFKVGDEVELLPIKKKAKIRSLQTHFQSVEEAVAGSRVAVGLAGIKQEEVSRGDVICAQGVCVASEAIDLKVDLIGEVKHGQRLRMSYGAGEVLGKAFRNDHDDSLLQFRGEKPFAITKGQRVILRQYSPPIVLAGGTVMEPLAEKRRKNAVAKGGGDWQEWLSRRPEGVKAAKFLAQTGWAKEEIQERVKEARKANQLVVLGPLVFSFDNFENLKAQAILNLKSLHSQRSEQAYVAKNLLVSVMKLGWANQELDAFFKLLDEQKLIRRRGNGIAEYHHKVELKPKQRELLDRITEILVKDEVNVTLPHELSRSLNIPQQAVEEVLKVGVDAEEIIYLGEGLFYPIATWDKMVRAVRKNLGGQRFTAGEFRTLFNTSRKYAIPILEKMDALGVTQRQGDARVVVKND